MKKLVSFILVFCVLLGMAVYADEPTLQSPAAILINADTGEVLYEKNADTKMYPASTTKIMTALLALENGNLTDVVTASFEAVNTVELGSSNIGLLTGEEITLEQLLYGLLIPSGNDCANVIAEYVSGSVRDFVELMNARAEELGCTNTNFVTANGLHDDNHYSSARDLAIIAKKAMEYPVFREIVKTARWTRPQTNKYPEDCVLSTTNKLVDNASSYYYSAATGIKTGYTSNAKNCLVASSELKDVRFISVVLGASVIDNDILSFSETKKLFEYGYDNYTMQTIVPGGTYLAEKPIKSAKGAKFIKLEAEEALEVVLKNDVDLAQITSELTIAEPIKAPLLKGDKLGTADYYYQGKLIGSVDLVADADYTYSRFAVIGEFFHSIFSSPVLYILLGLVLVFLLIVRQIRYNRRRRRRRNRRYGGKL